LVLLSMGFTLVGCHETDSAREEKEQIRFTENRLGLWKQLFRNGRFGFWQGCKEEVSNNGFNLSRIALIRQSPGWKGTLQ